MQTPIYLDYAATTPLDPRVVEKMLLWMNAGFGNPSSAHYYGRQAMAAIEIARQQVADLINTDSKNIIWTSGATEAVNLAIKGVAHFYSNKGKHIVTCQTEHAATMDSCRQLEAEGFSVTYLIPEKNGLLDLAKLEAALRPDTMLISIMHVNNETGVVQDIAAIGELARQKDILFHVDAAQSAGKLAIDLANLSVDLMSFSAHKIYGPKGVGALHIKPGVQLQPQIHGGGQECDLRSGTLATHQIVGMGEAFHIARQQLSEEAKHIKQLRDHFWDSIQVLGGVSLNGDSGVGILNIAFQGLENKVLLPALRDLAISTGSACHSASHEPSRVLKAMGISDGLARSSLRFSFGRFTTPGEVDFAVDKVRTALGFLRKL